MQYTRLAPLATLLLVPLALVPAAPAHAEAFILEGDVTNGLDASLSGVTVRVSNGATTTTDAQGDYTLPSLPAGSYTIDYSAPGYVTTSYDGVERATVTIDGAGNASVTIDGETEPVTDNVLDTVVLQTPSPTMTSAPGLDGKVAPGESVEAKLGTWNPDFRDVAADEDWRDYVTIDWLLDGKAADEYSDGYYLQNFDVPAEAGGKQLSFRLTIEDAEGVWAPITYTSAGVAVPKAQTTLKASYAGGKVKVVVTVAGQTKPTGRLTVTEGTKKVGKAKLAASKKGKTSVPVRLKKGKHKLVVSFDGGKSVETATTKLKVKI